ncbi:ROK family transcriptional regulator [Nonomuraea sp. NPDC005983]|uniref:ROK family transcriptional regulator n=1 Tax=Nonomuraea sp. NPDC005983 TaxID=3155595 RepID=UPI0033BDBE72
MLQQSGDASLLRRLNSAAILRLLRDAEVLTLSELARGARVSRPTVEAIVEELVSEGWAEECPDEPGDRPRGRPARRFRFRASAGHVVGVSIGHTSVQAMVADLNGAIVAVQAIPISPDVCAADRLAAVGDLVTAVTAQAGLAVHEVAAVGVGTTGVVDGDGRVVKSVVLSDWTGVPLQAELAARLPVPVVVVENDMRLAVIAEHWRGVAQGYDDVVYLYTGTRLGLGLLIGGVPYRGAHAASGEIGKMPTGTWAAFKEVTDYAMSVEPGELRSPMESARFAIERARQGDAEASDAVRAFGVGLGESLITIVNPLDPELVVIGGSLSPAGDLLVGPVKEVFDEICLYPPLVVASELGSESITLGAVRLALNHIDKALFS